MPGSVAPSLPAGKRKMLSAPFAPGDVAGQKLSESEIARAFGALISRALDIAGRTAKDVQAALDYANTSPVSKLTHPVEASPFARLLAVEWFADAYLQALAERRSQSVSAKTVRIKTVVEIERTA